MERGGEAKGREGRFGDVLTLDLEDVEGKEDDLSDTGEAAKSGTVSMADEEQGWGDTTHDPAVAAIIAFPFFSPKALSKEDLKFLLKKSLKYGCPPNWKAAEQRSARGEKKVGGGRKTYLVNAPSEERKQQGGKVSFSRSRRQEERGALHDCGKKIEGQ